MSVDIKRMVAHLPRERQVAVLRAYRRQAKHDTTAFLYCFFLGTLGVHRLYLGQTRAALPRLLMGAAFLIVLGAGLALAWPLPVVIGIPAALAVIMLGWEILDLFQIDAQVDAYNRALIARLLAGETAAASARPAPARVGTGTITAEDIAGAQALAREVGAGRAAGYAESAAAASDLDGFGSFQPGAPLAAGAAALLAGDPTDTHSQARPPQPVADVEGGHPITVTLTPPAAAPSLPPLADDQADARRAEPAVSTSAGDDGRGPWSASVPPPAPEPPAPVSLEPAPPGRDVTDVPPPGLPSVPVADIKTDAADAVYVALAGEEAVPAAADGVVAAVPAPPPPASDDAALLLLVPREEDGQSSPPSWSTPTQPMVRGAQPPAAPVPAEQYVPPTVTPSEAPPAAPPVWPVAPEEVPPAPPIWPVSPPAAGGEDSTQTLAELAAFGAGTAAAGAAAAGQAAEHPAPGHADAPAPDARAADAAPTGAAPSTPAEVAGAQPAPPPAETAPPASEEDATPTQPMKRVRVVRRVVLEDGGVVRELVAERIVPMDADSQAVAAELDAQLAHATPEEIAQLAHLPADTSVVVRSRVESGPLSGPLAKPEEPPAQGS